jgi:hypothetical protein
MQKFRDAVFVATDRPAGAMRPAGGTSVTVKNLDGSTPTLYSDNGVTPLASNVVTTDSSGEYSFYAANGRYNLTVASQSGSEAVSDVLLYDPANAQSAVLLNNGAVWNTTYLGDSARSWTVGNVGFGQSLSAVPTTEYPVVRIQKDTSYTGGVAANPSALSVKQNISGGVTNKANAAIFEIDCNAASHAQSATAYQAEGRKNVVANTNLITANIVAKDLTTRSSSVSGGSCVGAEIDVVASGPDDAANGRRFGVDLIARAPLGVASPDGANGVLALMRMRNSEPASSDPITATHGLYVVPNMSNGGITNGVTIDDAGTFGMLVQGAPSTAHIRIKAADTMAGTMSIGSDRQATGTVVGQLQGTGKDSSGGAQVNYADIQFVTGSSITAGAAYGQLLFRSRQNGTMTEEGRYAGGWRFGNPTGGAKGIGSINLAGNLYFNGAQGTFYAGSAVGNGSTDDAAALAAIITAAGAQVGANFGRAFIDLMGRKYGIGSGLTLPTGVYLVNGALKAVGSSWALTDPMVTINNVENAGLIGVELDAQWKCAGLLRTTALRSHVRDCRIQRFKTYGVKDTGTTQESTLTESVIRQYVFGDSGYDSIANRDAYGLWVDTADSMYANVVCAYALYPLYVTGNLGLFSQIHAYNGATVDGADNVAARIEGANASNNQFTNCYFDNGVLQVVDNFKQSLTGCHFQRTAAANTTRAIDLITSTATNTAAGLGAVNCKFNGSFSSGHLVFSTTGAGSWATNKQMVWSGNRDTSGGIAGGIVDQQLAFWRVVDGTSTSGNGFGAELLALDGGAGNNRLYQVLSGGSLRWAWGASNAAESGANAGSSFVVNRYDDSGAFVDSPLTIARDTGVLAELLKTSATPASNSQMTFQLTSNTQLTIKVKGSDGTVRSANITLA